MLINGGGWGELPPPAYSANSDRASRAERARTRCSQGPTFEGTPTGAVAETGGHQIDLTMHGQFEGNKAMLY